MEDKNSKMIGNYEELIEMSVMCIRHAAKHDKDKDGGAAICAALNKVSARVNDIATDLWVQARKVIKP